MKNVLGISLLLNLGLGGCVWFLVATRREPVSEMVLPVAAPVQTVNARPSIPPPVAPPPEPAPFRWSQLESKDYHIYVKKLRESGCPEFTVRAIVAADVHVVFNKFSSDLEQQLSALDRASWSVRLSAFDTEQALRAKMQTLPALETAETADLLGLPPPPMKRRPPARQQSRRCQ